MVKTMYAVKEQTTCDLIGIYTYLEDAEDKCKELNKIHNADDQMKDLFGEVTYQGYYDSLPRYYVSEIEVKE